MHRDRRESCRHRLAARAGGGWYQSSGAPTGCAGGTKRCARTDGSGDSPETSDSSVAPRTCPHCRSQAVTRPWIGRRVLWAAIVALMISGGILLPLTLALFVAYLIMMRPYRCADCGHEWTPPCLRPAGGASRLMHPLMHTIRSDNSTSRRHSTCRASPSTIRPAVSARCRDTCLALRPFPIRAFPRRLVGPGCEAEVTALGQPAWIVFHEITNVGSWKYYAHTFSAAPDRPPSVRRAGMRSHFRCSTPPPSTHRTLRRRPTTRRPVRQHFAASSSLSGRADETEKQL